MYSASASETTYSALVSIANTILTAGYSVIVDASFLKRSQRAMFFELALTGPFEFRILHFESDEATLRRRIADRIAQARDPSDADASVLELQLQTQEPLDADEARWVM
jgi:predicted kinase